jgi:nitrogen regulatory protein P-II 1
MTKLILFVLDDPSRTVPVLEAWARAGVSGATILQSSGLGRELQSRDDLPLIPSLRAILREQEQTHRTLFTIVPDSFDIPALIGATETVTGPLADPHTGILIVLPVLEVHGLREGETIFSG